MSTYLELNKDLTPAQTALKAETHKFAEDVLRPASLELDKLSPEDVIREGSAMWDVGATFRSPARGLKASPTLR